MCDDSMALSMAKIYNAILLDNPLSISVSQLENNIRVCQKESGYYLPIDILQCFTTGCKPKMHARKARITSEQCEHKLLVHIGYIITRIANEHCTDWSTQGGVFMEKGRVDEDVLDLLSADFPLWFRRLPTMTVLFFFVYVFAAQLYIASEMNTHKKTFVEMLRACDEHDSWHHVMESVKQFFGERIPLSQSDISHEAHMLDMLEQYVEHGVKSDLKASQQLLHDLNKIFPLSCALNSECSARISESWRVECHDMDGTPKLKRFETRDWKWLLFETPLHDWIDALRRLYRQRNDDVHTLVTTYQLCNATCGKKLKGGMEWHGYKEADGVHMLRPVRLQSDMLWIWTQLIALTQPFTVAALSETRSDLCAPLRAHLGAFVDGALLIATVFHDCGARFIDGAHVIWREAKHARGCQQRDCELCAGAAPRSPGSGVSEEGEA